MDCAGLRHKQNMPIKLWIKRSKIGQAEKSLEFAENELYVTFSIFVPEKFLNTNIN